MYAAVIMESGIATRAVQFDDFEDATLYLAIKGYYIDWQQENLLHHSKQTDKDALILPLYEGDAS